MTLVATRPSDALCRSELKAINTNEPLCLRGEVSRASLEKSYLHVEGFFQDLANHGCVSGMIPGLVYYFDTHAFFDLHYSEIEELREEFEDQTGQPLQINGDLKNALAWFAFEQTAFRLAEELGLEC